MQKILHVRLKIAEFDPSSGIYGPRSVTRWIIQRFPSNCVLCPLNYCLTFPWKWSVILTIKKQIMSISLLNTRAT